MGFFANLDGPAEPVPAPATIAETLVRPGQTEGDAQEGRGRRTCRCSPRPGR